MADVLFVQVVDGLQHLLRDALRVGLAVHLVSAKTFENKMEQLIIRTIIKVYPSKQIRLPVIFTSRNSNL